MFANSSNGAGVTWSGGTAAFTGCTIWNNSTTGDAVVTYYGTDSVLTVTGSTFAENSGGGNGGAIQGHSGCTVYVGDVVFSGNTSLDGVGGGAMYIRQEAHIIGQITLATATDTIRNTGTITVDAANFFPAENTPEIATVISASGFGSGTGTNWLVGNAISSPAGYDVVQDQTGYYLLAPDLEYTSACIVSSDVKHLLKVNGMTFAGTYFDSAAAALSSASSSTPIVCEMDLAERFGSYHSREVYFVNAAASGGSSSEGGMFYDYGANDRLHIWNAMIAGNSAGKGGAIRFQGALLDLQGATFSGNSAGSWGGAIQIDAGTGSFDNTVFSGNSASVGGAIYNNTGVALSVSNTHFHTASDTIYNLGTLNFSAVNYLNASITGGGTVEVTENAALIFGNTAGIDIAALTFDGGNAVTFNGTKTVNFASQDLSDVAITVGTGNLPAKGASFTIASGVSGMGSTITVEGVADPVTLGQKIEIGGGTYTYALDGTDFKVTQAWTWYNFVSAAPEGTESIVVNGATIALLNRYDTIGEAQSHLLSGGTLAVADLNIVGQESPCQFTDNGIVSGATFTGNCSATYGGAIIVPTSNIAATNVVIADSTFAGNTAVQRGGALFLRGKSGATADFTISGSTFSGNTACGGSGAWDGVGGAIYFQNSAGSLTIDGSARTVIFDGPEEICHYFAALLGQNSTRNLCFWMHQRWGKFGESTFFVGSPIYNSLNL